MTADFAGKTALITGAGRGIGRALALGLGEAGSSVVLLARSETQLHETRALLLRRGVRAQRIRVVPTDLANDQQRSQAAAAGGPSPRTFRAPLSRLCRSAETRISD